jgi:hypothetical protein
MKTGATDSRPAQNYSIGVFNQSLWARSVLRGYVTNRQAQTRTNGMDKDDFGRNAGMEFNYLNESGTWNYFGSLHISEKPEYGMGTYTQLGAEYAGRKWSSRINYFNITSDYHADIGFIPQLSNYDAVNDTLYHIGYEHFHGRVGYTIRPRAVKRIIAHDFELRNSTNWYADGTLSDTETRFTYDVRFRNTSRLTLQAQDFETRLLYATSFTDGEPLVPGSYRYPRVSLAYNTDARKSFPIQSQKNF